MEPHPAASRDTRRRWASSKPGARKGPVTARRLARAPRCRGSIPRSRPSSGRPRARRRPPVLHPSSSMAAFKLGQQVALCRRSSSAKFYVPPADTPPRPPTCRGPPGGISRPVGRRVDAARRGGGGLTDCPQSGHGDHRPETPRRSPHARRTAAYSLSSLARRSGWRRSSRGFDTIGMIKPSPLSAGWRAWHMAR